MHNEINLFSGERVSIEQQFKAQQMIELMSHRWEKYERIEAVNTLPPLEHFAGYPVWLGTWSRTSTVMKEKYLLRPTGVRVALDIPTLATPSEVARTWVDVTIKKRLRATKEQLNFWAEYNHSAPYMARRGTYANMVYMDLKSAYWSIMQIIGWGAEYHDDMIVRRYGVEDFPYPHEKLARNALATVALSGVSHMYKDGDFIPVKGKRIVNDGLFYLINDILHCVAMDMLEFKPVYVNTDGFIIPAEHQHTATQKILDHWGLLLTERHRGLARVYGVGSYKIGKHNTKRITSFGDSTRWINEKINYRMLRKWVRFLADIYPPKYPNLE